MSSRVVNRRAIAAALVCVVMLAVPGLASAQIVNGDFETGDFTGWTNTGPHNADVTTRHSSYVGHIDILYGHAAGSGPPNAEWELVFQEVVLPSSADSLVFWMEVTGHAWHDGGFVYLKQDTFIRLFATGGGGGSGQSYPWQQYEVDISPWAGQTVDIVFGGMNRNGFSDHQCDIWFDDIEITGAEPESLDPEVEVTLPNGGETWTVGQIWTTTWTAFDSSGVVSDSVYYSTDDGGSWIALAEQAGNPQSYEWLIPNTLSDECLLKVVAYDRWDNRGEDESDVVFAIVADTVAPTVTVTAPNGGEAWGTGEMHSIRWDADDNVAVVGDSVYYSLDDGATWIPEAYQTGNPQNYSWVVPDSVSTTCLVKVVVFDGGGLSDVDESDSCFTIFDRPAGEYRYAIIVSNATHADSGWAEVVDALASRHTGQVFTYASNISETQAAVATYEPDYVAFVCTVPEANATFVQSHAWPYMRGLDADPFCDAIWGIVTGCESADALRIVTGPTQMTIRTMLGGTSSCNVNSYPQGIGTNEVTYGRYYLKHPDSVKSYVCDDGPRDRTNWLVDMINGDSLIFDDTVDIFVTSGHGNHNIWVMHYPSGEEGYFRSSGMGRLYGDPYSGSDVDIISSHPKIYFALGNCKVGKIQENGSMMPAWIRNGGAYLATGYVINEGSQSYQHGATKAYFCLQDHCAWPEAFFLGNCVFRFDLDNHTPGVTSPPDFSGAGMYGDPAIDARIPNAGTYDTLLYTKELVVSPGYDHDTITFRITMNKNGRPGYTGKWGYRSPIIRLPFRVDSVEIIDTNADTAVIADNFVLMYIWHQGQTDLPMGTERYVTFTAVRHHVGITEPGTLPVLPAVATLVSTSPNPFSGRAAIRYNLAGSEARVSLQVFDRTGRLARTLVNEQQRPGVHTAVWDGRDDSGHELAAGVYFCRLQANEQTSSRKLMLLRK